MELICIMQRVHFQVWVGAFNCQQIFFRYLWYCRLVWHWWNSTDWGLIDIFFYRSECRNCCLYIIIQKITPQAESGKYFQICFSPIWGEKWGRSEHAHASYRGTLSSLAWVQPLLLLWQAMAKYSGHSTNGIYNKCRIIYVFRLLRLFLFFHITEENMVRVVLLFVLVVLALASEGKKVRKYWDAVQYLFHDSVTRVNFWNYNNNNNNI